jgi:hypothetical protein
MKRLWTLATFLAIIAAGASAQESDIASRLRDAGAGQEFAQQVATIVAAAQAEGLPTGPIEEKAIEGWAKRNRVTPDRVITVLEQTHLRLREANQIAMETHLELHDARGAAVAAAAEALGRHMNREQVRELIESAPTPEAAAAGLTVAASLVAQGLDADAAVHAVQAANRGGGPPENVYELPSAMANMRARGATLNDVARQILEGGGLPMPGGVGAGVGGNGGPNRPSVLPPSKGRGNPQGQPPENPGGQGKKNPGGTL